VSYAGQCKGFDRKSIRIPLSSFGEVRAAEEVPYSLNSQYLMLIVGEYHMWNFCWVVGGLSWYRLVYNYPVIETVFSKLRTPE